jgi:penicillin-binding protein 1A
LARGEKQNNIDDKTEKQKSLQGALVAVAPGTGAIQVMVGGKDISLSQYNRAVSNNRQPGSGFKPFVYFSTLQKLNYSPATVVKDEPVIFKILGSQDWEPINFNNKFTGSIVLKKSLMDSINVISAKLIDQIGVETVIENAIKFGIQSHLEKNMSLALGTSPVSPLEMASAFTVFASGGIYAKPFAIKRIEDFRGNVLEEKSPRYDKVFDPQLIYLMVDMMKGVVDDGTARRIRRMGFNRPAAGKTGTTNDFKDAWFTGFTPTLSTSVWVGYDDATPMQNKQGARITGSQGGIPIWVNFMKEAMKDEPVKDFPVPDNIEFAEVDPKTGYLVSEDSNSAEKIQVALLKGTSLNQLLLELENETAE